MDTTLYMSYTVAILVTVGLPIAVAASIVQRQASRWRFFLYGAVVYALAQAIRLLLVRMILATTLGQGTTVFIAVLAVSAGVLEEMGRYAGYVHLFRGDLSKPGGMIYGLGHGWAEGLAVAARMALTAYLFYALSRLDLSTVRFTTEQIEMITQARSPWFPLAGGFERLAMLPVHVMLSLLVLRSVMLRQSRWLVSAMGIHAAANLGMGLVMKHVGLAQGEILAALLGIGSILIVRRMKMEDQTESGGPTSPAGTITLTG